MSTCRHQHHGGEQSQLLGAQLQCGQLVAEVKHGAQQLAHPHRPQLRQAVGGARDEGYRLLLHVEQGREAHHQHLKEEGGDVSSIELQSIVFTSMTLDRARAG